MADNDGQSKNVLSSILSFTQGILPLLVAIVVLYFFWTQLKGMMDLANKNAAEPIWSRSAYLYGGVEAIAFAAAGFLFGREVHRQRAEKAEERADDAQQQADKAKTKATEAETKGRSLAELAKLKASAQSQSGDEAAGLVSPGSAGQGAAKADMNEIANMARTLFPDA